MFPLFPSHAERRHYNEEGERWRGKRRWDQGGKKKKRKRISSDKVKVRQRLRRTRLSECLKTTHQSEIRGNDELIMKRMMIVTKQQVKGSHVLQNHLLHVLPVDALAQWKISED